MSPPRFAFFLWPLRTLRTVKPLSIPPRPRAVQLYTSTVGCSHAFLRECEYRDCSDQSVRACVTRREDGRHRHSRLRLTHNPHWAAPRHTARGPERGVGSPYLLRRSSAARYVPCASWVAPEACGRNGNRHGRTRATSGRRASASLWRRRGNMRRKCKYVARVRVGRSLPVCNVKNTVIIIGVSHGPGSAAAYTRACSAALRGRRRRACTCVRVVRCVVASVPPPESPCMRKRRSRAARLVVCAHRVAARVAYIRMWHTQARSLRVQPCGLWVPHGEHQQERRGYLCTTHPPRARSAPALCRRPAVRDTAR